MKSYIGMIALSIVALFPFIVQAQQEPALEACQMFEVTVTRSLGNKNERVATTCFTPAALPWAKLFVSKDTAMKLTGFTAAPKKQEQLQTEAGKFDCRKITQTHTPDVWANIDAAKIEYWETDSLATPSFGLKSLSGSSVPVPAGCVKLTVTPLPVNDQGEPENTLAVNGEYKGPVQFQVGKKAFKAHKFVATITQGGQTVEAEYILSRDMPGKICGVTITGTIRGQQASEAIRITGISDAPVPENLDYYPDAFLAFAAPEGYSKTAPKEPGVIARYSGPNGAWIAIHVSDAGKRTLDDIYEEFGKKAQEEPIGLVISSGHHLAGSATFDVYPEEMEYGCIYAVHAGKVVCLRVSALSRLRPPEVTKFLKGWRWIAPPTEKSEHPDSSKKPS